MMERSKNVARAVLAAVLVANAGCMSFRSGQTQLSGPWPMEAPGKRQRVSIVVRHEVEINGRKTDPNPSGTEKITDWILDAYRDANLFGGVRRGMAAGGGEYQVDVTLRNFGDPSIGLAILSGLTLTLFPAVATDNFSMTTAVRGPDGSVLAEVERRDSMSTWIELFLIFGTPFAPPNAVAEELIRTLTQASIQDLHQRGVW